MDNENIYHTQQFLSVYKVNTKHKNVPGIVRQWSCACGTVLGKRISSRDAVPHPVSAHRAHLFYSSA